MSVTIEGINTPIGTPNGAVNSPRNSRGCLTKCPECGASLAGAEPASLTASPTPSLSPNSSIPAPAEKKGLLGLGFLGLGGRRRTHRRHGATKRRRAATRRHRRSQRKH